jgi:2-C-methyl-D-erythritol 4-phosphate cytidylyltransferase/2-C-methyl-D-erythritol 2,4-cyclodiphosphate synthase
MHVTAIIAAAGRGQRFGGELPKQLVTIDGRSILERSTELFVAHPAVTDVIVALPPEFVANPPAFLIRASKPLRLVEGGARRQDSVRNAFNAAWAESDIIVIHDAARPFASADLVSRTIRAAAQSGAALAAISARDTLKLAARGEMVVESTLPRDAVFLAQTPQAFRREILRTALARDEHDGGEATDEAALVERAGYTVSIVEGEPTNFKITTPEDLPIAEAIARQGRPVRTGRAGIGYDVHRLVDGRPLVLGGVAIPFERGLAGHSDADAVCHAISDAVLGAAAAGDIGRHFPDSDPRWRGASSVDLLGRIARIVRDLGFEIGNVDASVIAERPKLAPYVDEMCRNVAWALGIPPERVSIKGKTNEGVGELGRGEAIAVHAIALLRRS